MAAVAHRARCDHRRERDAQAVAGGHRAHGVAYQDRAVGRTHRVLGGDRHLELPWRVLGVELKHRQTLGVQGPEDVAQVVGALDDARHAVCGTVGRHLGHRARLGHPGRPVGRSGPRRDPLHLEARAQREAPVRRRVAHAPRELPCAARVDVSVLGDAVARRPGPAGLCGQRDEPVKVGDEAQIADRAADPGALGDRVVHQEHVEARRRADTPCRRVLQLPDGDGLHAADARVVDPADHHAGHVARGQLGRGDPGARRAFGPQLGVHRHGCVGSPVEGRGRGSLGGRHAAILPGSTDCRKLPVRVTSAGGRSGCGVRTAP